MCSVDLLPTAAPCRQRLRRDREPVADASAQSTTTSSARADRHRRGPARSPRRPQPRRPRRSGAWLTLQIATASASAAWSRDGSVREPQHARTIRATCSLSARPLTANRRLDLLGRVGEARDGRAGRRRAPTTPRACPTANALRTLTPKYRSSIAIASGAVLLDQRAERERAVSQPRSIGSRRRSRSRRRQARRVAPPRADHAVTGVRGTGVDSEHDHLFVDSARSVGRLRGFRGGLRAPQPPLFTPKALVQRIWKPAPSSRARLTAPVDVLP